MKRSTVWRRAAIITLSCLLVVLPLPGLARAAAAAPLAYPTFADPAFQTVWERYDRLVYYGDAARSYTWGGANTQGLQEPYTQGPTGQHMVQYFDKARMEINNPGGDPGDPYYVTTGLLAEDMIMGRVQVGDSDFQQATPAAIPFGDLDDAQASSPTYASFKGVLGAPALAAGQPITTTLDRAGDVADNANALGVTSAGVLPGVTTNHSIASVFLTFLQSTGPVYQGEQNVTAAIFDPLFYVTGYPITEAYWATLKAGGTNQMVLIQCFERRCLTYTPTNESAFRVELANTGLQYYTWRYAIPSPSPSPTPTPSPSPSPSQMPIITNINVGNVTQNGATITWDTDQPATSEVDYGTSISYGQTVQDGSLVTAHAIMLANLGTATGYNFRVASANGSGARAVSGNQTFTTTNVPGPAIGAVGVSTTATTANFQFTTTPDATVQLTYELPGNDSSALTYSESGPSVSHSITIGGLSAGTTYTYQLIATSADGGQTVGAATAFTTVAQQTQLGPAIGPITVTPRATSARLAYTTSPAATVQITYHANGATNDDIIITDNVVSTDHSTTLSGLAPNTGYTYRIVATTPAGGQTTSAAATFTTLGAEPVGPTIGTPVITTTRTGAPTIQLTFGTTPAATVEIVYHVTGDNANTKTLVEPGGAQTEHRVEFNAVRPNTSYTFRIIATGTDGAQTTSRQYTILTPGPR